MQPPTGRMPDATDRRIDKLPPPPRTRAAATDRRRSRPAPTDPARPIPRPEGPRPPLPPLQRDGTASPATAGISPPNTERALGHAAPATPYTNETQSRTRHSRSPQHAMPTPPPAPRADPEPPIPAAHSMTPAETAPPAGPMPQGFPPPGPPTASVPNPGLPNPGLPNPGPPNQGPPLLTGGLDDVALLRKVRRAPTHGWRRLIHTLTGGAINPGESSSDIEYARLLERVNRPVRGDYRIAVLSLKGGVGKTTTSIGLGSTFAWLRGDRVIAVDANPDLGTLAQRVPQQTGSTVRDLVADRSVTTYADVRAHTSQAVSRLEVLASERDPAAAETFDADEYRAVMNVLQRFYNIIITDCGTGLSHSAMTGVLDLAHAVILVTSPAMDGARSAAATLDWLSSHGYAHLVPRSVVVLSSSRPGASTIDTVKLAQHFLTRCRAVQRIPFDDHLAEGAEIDLDLVNKQTRLAFVELAATMADDFASNQRSREGFNSFG
ncbi:AAA family ATPase [Gordonia amarae]|nr:AAA family ATPase [Gordonia amarae]QHN33412.1 AAA family ATPase [Gordonia amarae]QHN42133.1 AAA family ATPase [Gordonia amarae]